MFIFFNILDSSPSSHLRSTSRDRGDGRSEDSTAIDDDVFTFPSTDITDENEKSSSKALDKNNIDEQQIEHKKNSSQI